MLSVKNLLGILFLTSMLLLSSCTEDSNPVNNSSEDITEITNIIESNDWIITKMINSGDNYTNEFEGYVFTFNADGSLLADNSAESYTGTWWIGDDDSDDSDDSNDDVKFNINLTVTNYLNEIDEDWEIMSYTSTKIELIDESDDGDTDYLTFTKK